MVVQIELQQLKILRPDLAAKREVRTQTTVDVFYPTAAAKRHCSQVDDRWSQSVELATESTTQAFCFQTIL